MNRKDKIRLLNGLLKGEKPMVCIFSEWPEKIYYAESADADNLTTEDGEIISLEEVDHELQNYPKVRIIYKEPENEIKVTYTHKCIDENGVVIERKESGITDQESGWHTDLTIPNKSGLSNLTGDTDTEANPPSDPEPPPEPFLSRKDREVMAQGSLYCVR